jgi:hypothetical protein
MRFKRIWKRGENAYNWRVNRRARRYMYETGGAHQNGCIMFLFVVFIVCLTLAGLGVK